MKSKETIYSFHEYNILHVRSNHPITSFDVTVTPKDIPKCLKLQYQIKMIVDLHSE